jgi:predicted dehydrogenase
VNRAAIVGAGSIGQRHIRNLRTLGVTDIVALRTRRGHTQALDPSLGVREVEGWRELAGEAPDVAIVANATALHLEAAMQLASVVRGLFIEKPVAASLAEARQICHAIRTHRIVSFVGHVLQFHPVVRTLDRAMFDATYGSPLALQAQAGQWLPDWHPEEDYRRSFAARADLGGGVVRTLMHELHLAIQLLGAPRTVSCVTARSPRLDIDVESSADLTIRHASGAVSQLHLDYLQRPPSRFGALICERGTLRYDLATPRVAAIGERGAATLFDGAVDFNDCYVDELRTFLRYVREGQVRHEHDVERALPAIAAIDAAFASDAQQRIVAVA